MSAWPALFPLSPLCSRVSNSTMALQQAQLLLNMSSLEPVNFGVQQNNTEAFAVALCHLAELHAEQVTHLIWSRLSSFFPRCCISISQLTQRCGKAINVDLVVFPAPEQSLTCLFLLAGPVLCRFRDPPASERTVSSSLTACQGVFSQPYCIIQYCPTKAGSSNCWKREVEEQV